MQVHVQTAVAEPRAAIPLRAANWTNRKRKPPLNGTLRLREPPAGWGPMPNGDPDSLVLWGEADGEEKEA